MTEYEYITISNVGPSKSGRTEIFNVISKSGIGILGQIRWLGNWRQYAFEPNGGTIYSKGFCAT